MKYKDILKLESEIKEINDKATDEDARFKTLLFAAAWYNYLKK
jgi:hypothetical protein